MRSWTIVLLVAGACGSPGGDEAVDAAPADAPPVDAGPADAAPPDAVPCDVELPCPAPGPTNVSVCGRIYDVETSAPLANGEGAPAVEVTIRGFFGPPLYTTLPDSCGRYQFVDIPVPSAAPMVPVAVDDIGGVEDVYAGVVVVQVVQAGNAHRLAAFAARRTTDVAWTETAGSPFGAGGTFMEEYTVMAIVVDTTKPPVGPLPGAPVAGAAPSAPGDTVYYFADEDPLMRTTVNTSLTVTGANGSMLVPQRDLRVFTAVGPAGCTWDVHDATGVAGMLFVLIVEGECP